MAASLLTTLKLWLRMDKGGGQNLKEGIERGTYRAQVDRWGKRGAREETPKGVDKKEMG